MKQVRNADGRLVCQVDEVGKAVEILVKGFKTVIRFAANGRVEIVNTKPAA